MTLTSIRDQFPILHQTVNGHPLAYLDNGASTQKPRSVIDAIVSLYEHDYANVHRGIHTLSERASALYDSARARIASFIGAQHAHELIFTRGTTESINLVASSYLEPRLSKGDAVVTTLMEHHSNFVPWQQLCLKAGAELRVVPILDNGTLDIQALASMLDSRVKLLSVVHVSNVLGVINPIEQIVSLAHRYHIPVLVDGAQSIAHLPVNVVELDVDFLAFSGHKMYGPTGIGGLYAKQQYLNEMRPYQYGGDMIAKVSLEESTWNDLPYKFEAGTPNIAGAIGLGAAIDFLQAIGMEQVREHEVELLEFLSKQLTNVKGLSILGPGRLHQRSGLIAFWTDGIHPHDISTIADERGVAVRAGFHCAEPLHRSLGLMGSIRASLGVYSTKAEVDQLVGALNEALRIFGV